MKGKLYLVGTPIGNLEDITYRAVRILREVDLIAAEDTRHSGVLLKHLEVATPMTSYHEHNEVEKSEELIRQMEAGKEIALISDAGMPGISDPGYRLVRAAQEAEMEIIPVPGPTALISALVVSGLATDRFVFEGFLPRKQKQRREKLQQLLIEPRTIIFYESPHRLLSSLQDIEEVMGAARQVAVVRELTKKHEEKKQGSIQEVLTYYREHPPRGEIVLLVAGSEVDELAGGDVGFEEMTVLEHLQTFIDAGMSKKQAIKTVAKERKLPKSEVYQEAIQIEIDQ